ncbi:TPM domain-containing protein [Stakelama sp. CBK3Z-3]|uniref:TPM domain-containing protein n=1 Tax=Stakelama flava TaxID=2860338 RepID=A0ABS6XIY6_9SPHN|nr:TPM domain-containing protein [Stakelama flava]MBW4330173.1 TPM domain-containing protein [Stakelama flava]
MAALIALLVMALPVSAQTFPKLTGRVVDAANLLTPAQEQQLDQLSAQIEQASGRQFVVATIPDLQGYPIEDYGYRLGRAWKIGQAKANNGIILIVAPKERRVRIEVGYGLEPIMTDALSSMIIHDDILPQFRKGDMAAGIMAGSAAIAQQMKLPLEAAEQRAKQKLDARQQASGSGDDGSGWIVGLFWIAILFFVVMPMLFGRARGRRYRRGIGPVVIWGPGFGGGGSGWGGGSSGGFGGGGFGGGGFSGGGGSFGGGGASGGW